MLVGSSNLGMQVLPWRMHFASEVKTFIGFVGETLVHLAISILLV
jgi:hypothetical protein